jgi:hypothetical protein
MLDLPAVWESQVDQRVFLGIRSGLIGIRQRSHSQSGQEEETCGFHIQGVVKCAALGFVAFNATRNPWGILSQFAFSKL